MRRPLAQVAAGLRKFGVAGFVFFFVKGLLWLVLPLALAAMGCER